MALKVGELFASMFLDDSAFRQGLDKAQGRFTSVGNQMVGIGKKSSLLLTAPIMAAGTAMTKTIMDFDRSMTKVEALSGATGAELESLEAIARKMGAETSKTASDAADALGYMALAGWDVQSSIKGLEPILRLSEAAEMDLGRASDLVTDSMAALGLGVDELDNYLDIVASTMANANTDADQLMQAMLGAGGTFRNLKVPLSEANALLGVLANRGTKGSEAGSSLNSIFMNLTTGLGRAGEAMEELGISAFDQNGEFIGMAETLKLVANATKDMNDEQRNYYLAMIGGKTQVDTLMKLLAGVNEEYEDLRDTVEDSEGALMDMSATIRDDLKGDWDEFKSAVQELMLSFKDELIPELRNAVKWATELIRKWSGLSSNSKTLILRVLGLLAVFGPLMIFLGMLFKAFGLVLGVVKFLGAAMFVVKGGGIAAAGGITAASGAATLALTPFGLLLTAVAAVTTAVFLLRREFNQMDAEAQRIARESQAGSWGMGPVGASGLADQYAGYDPYTGKNDADRKADAEERAKLGKPATVKTSAMIAAEDAKRIANQDFTNSVLQGSYASGLARVPRDMPVLVHKDEAIIPASLNPYNPSNRGKQGNAPQASEVVHRGTIRVEGYDRAGEYDKVVQIIIQELRRELLT